MRFIIYGAGGIGGTIGARLHQQGADVVLIARGAHLEAMRTRGLRLVAPEGTHRLEVSAVGTPADIEFRADDVVLLCMKSQHTLRALEDLRALAPRVPVVCCQNGVANERTALRRFDDVYGMLVILPGLHLEPGVVITHATGVGGILDTGCYPGGEDARAAAVTAWLERAGFSARPDPGVMRLKYAKLLLNLNNALQAATEMASGAEEISRMLRQEALACFDAAGIDCATREEMRARRDCGMHYAEIPDAPRGGGSSWQSVKRGTGDIESDYLNGEVTLLGRLYGVPTPANAVVQRLGVTMAQRGEPPGAYTVAHVLELIEAERRAASA